MTVGRRLWLSDEDDAWKDKSPVAQAAEEITWAGLLERLVQLNNKKTTPMTEAKSPSTPVRLPAPWAMDPLSVTASVIAVATATLRTAKALYDVVDGLVDAPHSVSHSKSLLSQTQTTLGTLTRTLEMNSASGAVGSVLKEIELGKALASTQSLCQEFATTLTGFTRHSTDLHFSTRDRFILQFNESKIKRLNGDLADCQRTITMVFSSVMLYSLPPLKVASSTNTGQDRLQPHLRECRSASDSVRHTGAGTGRPGHATIHKKS